MPHCSGLPSRRILAAWLLAVLGGAIAGPGMAQSVERGKAVYEARCSGCHSVDAHRVGPSHRGVVGRRAGAAKGYEYSSALADSRLLWTRATLDAWLSDPEDVIPGQAMGYSLDDARERADVIAYLASLQRTPLAAAR